MSTNQTILECCHADTCLADYWCGHHRPHLQIAVRHGMSIADIKRALRHELQHGCVSGSCDDARLLNADFVGEDNEKRADALTRAAHAAINRMRPVKKGQRRFFTDLERRDDFDDDAETVYAFFVFMPLERGELSNSRRA